MYENETGRSVSVLYYFTGGGIGMPANFTGLILMEHVSRPQRGDSPPRKQHSNGREKHGLLITLI